MAKKNVGITCRLAGRLGVVAGGCVAATALWLGLSGSIGAAASTPQRSEYACFPTCVVDGRFLVVTGNDPTTLAGAQVVVGLNFPLAAGLGKADFDLFDGDRDPAGWDVKNTQTDAAPPELAIELYADPAGTGTSGPLLKTWAAGEITFMNNDWTGVTWPHDARAMTGAGPEQRYAYSLKISPAAPTVDLGWNTFKVRTRGTIHLIPQVFGFIGSLQAGSTYDGTWSFKFRVPAGADHVTVFDGDMDYGDAACSINDTDDPDSMGVPTFGAGAVAEGVASSGSLCTGGTGSRTGLPADDNSLAAFRRVPSLPGAGVVGIVYRLVAPDGQTFLNRNPSGNREWEQFRILKVANAPADPCPAAGFADHDCETTTLPEGVWEIQIDGMDMSNLNFFFLNFRIER